MGTLLIGGPWELSYMNARMERYNDEIYIATI